VARDTAKDFIDINLAAIGENVEPLHTLLGFNDGDSESLEGNPQLIFLTF
jgi:hypothetical protein